MNIPKNFKVGGMDYEVVFEDKLFTDDGLALLGMCDYYKNQIIIDDKIQNAQRVEQTFFHELAHAILYEQGINLQNMGLSYNDMENVVDGIGRGLHCLFKDNPNFMHECKCKAAETKVTVNPVEVGKDNYMLLNNDNMMPFR